MPITFKSLAREDFPQLVAWLNAPHVQQYWGRSGHAVTLAGVEKHLGPRVDYKENVFCYVVLIDQRPVGYIQHYDARCFAREGYDLAIIESFIKHIPRLGGMDLYIGNPGYLHKGHGTRIIEEFWQQKIAKTYDACLVDPQVTNTAALRAFEKSGFVKITQIAAKHADLQIMVRDKRSYIDDDVRWMTYDERAHHLEGLISEIATLRDGLQFQDEVISDDHSHDLLQQALNRAEAERAFVENAPNALDFLPDYLG